jgi:polyisoprenoid-binding protein YceI
LRRRPGRLVLAGVVVLAMALGGGYLLLAGRNADAPPPATLATPTPATGQLAKPDQDGASTSADGIWRVRQDGSSYVGYRVRERLAFLPSPNEAVGRTTAVTGTLRVDGETVQAATIQADLRELTSDESRRDNAIRGRGLESDRFPTAAFELAEPITLAQPPVRGRRVSAAGRGRLTVHGQTRDVTLTLHGVWNGDTIDVVGRLPVRMPDFGIQPPRFGPVEAISEDATIELSLIFERG